MRRALLAAAIAAAVILPAPRGWACSCVAQSRRAQLERADAVFAGSVESLRRSGPSGPAEASLVATVRVESIYKGRPAATSRVRTAKGQAACGIPFVAGRRYLVFAEGRGAVYRANVCGGTTADLDALEGTGVRARVLPTPTPLRAAREDGSRARSLLVGTGVVAGAALLIRLLVARRRENLP